jgi:hypothetical protein
MRPHATAIARTGAFETAQMYYTEAAEFIEAQLGTSHPLASAALLGQATLLHQRGQFDAAERSARRAMTLRQIAVLYCFTTCCTSTQCTDWREVGGGAAAGGTLASCVSGKLGN